MGSHSFPLAPSSAVDWQNLAFDPIEVNGHIQCTYTAETRQWSAPTFVKDPHLRVHGLAPGLNYGQQAFEGLKAFRTPTGAVQLFRLAAHAARFARSARVVAIPAVPEALFARAVRLAVALNSEYVPPSGGAAALYVRPVAFAASATVNMAPATRFAFCVFVLPVAALPAGARGGGLRAVVVEAMDRAAPRGTGGAKVGGNYGATVAVMRDARTAGYGLTLHLDSATRTTVDEFSASGFVGVRREAGGVAVVVPTGPAILKSVTVDSLCRIAESFGWSVERRAVLCSELAGLSEAFAVGTAFIMTPVRSITRESTSETVEYTVDYQSPTSAYSRLRSALQGVQEGTIDDAWGWTEQITRPSHDEYSVEQ